jgi:radical SAM protein with 4Fe4S-binding SPASM domain
LGAPCVIGRDGLCIMPNGSIFPCRRFPISIGNLLNDSLRQIWEESEILERLRTKENLKGKCGRCEMEDCRGCRSLALSLTGNYLEEDPHCQYGQRLVSNWYIFSYNAIKQSDQSLQIPFGTSTIVSDLNRLTSAMCHCERSEAILWDCHVSSFLAMTTFLSHLL